MESVFVSKHEAYTVLLEYFSRDKYSVSSPLGRHLLMGLLVTLPDNKVAEDVHASVRLASNGNSNDELSDVTIQDVISHSRVLETREISHDLAVPKETYIAEVNQTSAKSKCKQQPTQETHPAKEPRRAQTILHRGLE